MTTGYDDLILLIEVNGLCQQSVCQQVMFAVSHRSLARTFQFINHKGGKVVQINSLSLSLPVQGLWDPSVGLADREVDRIGTQPSPSFEADLRKSTLPEIILADSKSTQVSAVPEPEEFAALLVAESEILEPSKPSKLN